MSAVPHYYFVFLFLFPVVFCFQNKISTFIQSEYQFETYKEKYYSNKNKNSQSGKLVVETKYFDQLLDHFNYNTAKWKQQYFTFKTKKASRKSLFKKKTLDLAILCVGGEWDVTQDGGCYEYIKELLPKHKNSIGFALEHRFYGDSSPTGDLSVRSLTYLNANQALADLAYFVQKIIFGEYKVTQPPIVIGCSYAGTLTTWFRSKYNHLSIGAIALSPPLEAMLNFKEYYKLAYAAAESQDKKCLEKLPKAYKQLFELVQDKDSFEEKLGLCKTNVRNLDEIYPLIADSIWLYITYDFLFFAQYGVKSGMETICSTLKDKDIFAVAKDALNGMSRGGAEPCVDPYYIVDKVWVKQIEQQEAELGIETDTGTRPWYWQKCSEFGWFKTNTTTKKSFMGFTLKDFTDVCEAIFLINSTQLENSIERTNVEFGSLDITHLTRLLIINGQYDPWKGPSLPKHKGTYEQVVSIEVPNGHHCPTEEPETYKEINKAIKAWLKKKSTTNSAKWNHSTKEQFEKLFEWTFPGSVHNAIYY